MKSKQISSIVLSLLIFIVFGCSTAPQEPNLAEIPIPNPNQGIEAIAIVGTNDIHGGLAPFSLMTHENKDTLSLPYQAGGAATLAAYVDVLRAEWGDHLIWLDAGDEFQGSIDSNSQLGAPMVQFFNAMNINAAAVGNHEFDFGLPALKSRMSEAHYPYLAANIREKATGKLASFPNTSPHILLTVGHLKVGVIGLSTLDTPTTTRASNVRTLKFENLKTATLREAKYLREQGANIILLTAHAGLKCNPSSMPTHHSIRKPGDPEGKCGDNDEMVELLRDLPKGTVDAVVAGHTHQVVHQWVENVPVIEGGAFGRYFNVIYLAYDSNRHKILPNETRIEGPIPVCPMVFKNQNDCNGDRPAPPEGRGPLVTPIFHKVPIHPDPKIVALLEPTFKKSEKIKNQVLGMAAEPIEHIRMGESPLGNLVADSIRQAVHADVAYINAGGIRAPIEAGPITYEEVFRSMPFDNEIALIRVTGQELKMILRVAESGSRGYGSVSGIRLKLTDPTLDAPWDDLNRNGIKAPWKQNRLLDVTLSNGQPISPKKFYQLATIDFLVTGGDDFAWPISQIPSERINLSTGVLSRDAIVQYLKKYDSLNLPLNTRDHPLVDPASPRILFVKEKVKTRSKSYPHKRHRKNHAATTQFTFDSGEVIQSAFSR